ncbi:MAG: FKBP-type peptidyl-prolyl cis-trans isomerase [Acidimicrobiales bacterium]|nr:FKBP-type peptidyl-prolyl cis-trans isomerase [Acidimicrobiales bacterium]
MDTFEKPVVEVTSNAPPNELLIEDVLVGDGLECSAGQLISVDYVGVSWSNSAEFDSSWSRNEVFTFQLGVGQVIEGWDEGCVGMKVGGRRKLVIPPDKAYGSQGAGGIIGPDETLIFVVDLRSIG